MLVTDGAGVLAVEMVRTLAGCNANVVVLSRNQEQGVKIVKEINANSAGKGRVLYVPGDVLLTEALLYDSLHSTYVPSPINSNA